MKNPKFHSIALLTLVLGLFAFSFAGIAAEATSPANSPVTIISGPNNTGCINNLDVGSSSLFSLDSRGRYSTSLVNGNYYICVFAGASPSGDYTQYIDGSNSYVITVDNGNSCSCSKSKK